ncbi:MAG: chain-length determining protein [Gammaproteobacteria bacterium]|nr:chain-length determining protein [Gammaproteobacteria bacterium]
MTTPAPQSPVYDEEIDLFELAQDLWREKVVVLVVGAVVTLLALIYALVATPVYQTSSVLKPAKTKDLDQLNSLGVYELTPDSALDRVGAALESYETRLEFFKNNPALFQPLMRPGRTDEQNFDVINREGFKLLRPDPDPKKQQAFSGYVGLQLEYSRELDGPAIVNGLIQYAIERERTRLTEDLGVVITNKLESLQRDLNVLRVGYNTDKEVKITGLTESDNLKRLQLEDELAAIRMTLKTKRENRIKQLDEAIAIADSLGIKKPSTPSSLSEGTRVSGSVIKTEVNNQNIPLYFMGTDALEAERKILLSRENDDFTSDRIVEIQKELKLLENNRQIQILQSRENEDLFLAELADKEKAIAHLNSLKLNMDTLSLVTLDQPATQPSRAIKPKKTLIVAIGLVLGGMLGIFAALLRSAIRKRQQQTV